MLWCDNNKGSSSVSNPLMMRKLLSTSAPVLFFSVCAVYGIPYKDDAVEETLWRMAARLLVKVLGRSPTII